MAPEPSSRTVDAQLVERAWAALHRGVAIERITEISAAVSTNRVYRLRLAYGGEVVAKTSSYGSYVHFRQDHRLIQQWRRMLGGTRFSRFLAEILESEPGSVFTYQEGYRWVAFYENAPFYDFLPKVLDQRQIEALAREMAEFHTASYHCAQRMNPTWKTLGSDIAALYDVLGSKAWRQSRGFADEVEGQVRRQCDLFLNNAEKLGYHALPKLPVLVDWNIGNFSVGFDRDGFKLYSRWDYDWFRIEPRGMDFYFCSRVVRSDGDQTVFSYLATPLLEERFRLFLRAYHRVSPLAPEELLFLKEAYRFFILNYVVRMGEHFFRPSYCRRLQKEAIETYLPSLEQLDFEPLLRVLD